MESSYKRRLDELKDKMSTSVSILQWELGNMWGHVSARTPDGEHFLLQHLRPPMKPGIPLDDVLEYDLDGNLVFGRREQPDEIFFYTCPYRARKNVGAAIHCHPETAISLMAGGKKIVPVHLASCMFGKGVPVAPWLYGFWREDGEKATKIMGESCALMIRGHGAIVTGETIEEACINMVQLERTAKMIWMAATFGKVDRLSAGSIEKFRSVVGRRSGSAGEGPRPGTGALLEWRYYEYMLKKGQRWTRL